MKPTTLADLVDVVVVGDKVLLRVVANLFDAVVLLDKVGDFRAGEPKLGGAEHSTIFSLDNSFNINVSVLAVLVDGIEAGCALTDAAVGSSPSLVAVAAVVLAGIPRILVGDHQTVVDVIDVSECRSSRSVLCLCFCPFCGSFNFDWGKAVLVELNGHGASVHLGELGVRLADTVAIAVVGTLCSLARTAGVAVVAIAASAVTVASAHVRALTSFYVFRNSSLGFGDVTPGCSTRAGHQRAIWASPLSESHSNVFCVGVLDNGLTVGASK